MHKIAPYAAEPAPDSCDSSPPNERIICENKFNNEHQINNHEWMNESTIGEELPLQLFETLE